MLKLLICSALVGGMGGIGPICQAHAAGQAYEWRYSGFREMESGNWRDLVVEGRFVVDDADSDGTFSLGEVLSFSYDAWATECVKPGASTCRLHAFSFVPGGKLAFSASDYVQFEDGGSYATHVSAEDSWGFQFNFSPELGMEPYYELYLWTPETVASITPVPEPHAYALLLGGLAALLGLGRRQGRGWCARSACALRRPSRPRSTS